MLITIKHPLNNHSKNSYHIIIITYYKPTPSSARSSYIGIGCGIFVYKLSTYYKPTSLFRADVREIAHWLTIRYYRYLQPTNRHRTPQFYGIPKLHKHFTRVPPMHPILQTRSSLTQLYSLIMGRTCSCQQLYCLSQTHTHWKNSWQMSKPNICSTCILFWGEIYMYHL